mmetsp:Transcript_33877/g.107571  ORF Transcript_33877/g.107571 Transcript_33877/m.107571 type:complete len:220 (-) Transcript_33877:16-675(-)
MRFRYNKHFHKMDHEGFLNDFFNSPAVQEHFQVVDKKGQWGPSGPVEGVASEVVPATLTSMELFDKLGDAEPAVVRESGAIVKCMDEEHQGILVSDMLRDMLLNPDTEVEVYTEEEKGELLFRLFGHVVLGGPMCQYEDHVAAYLEVAKKLYKELMAVHKNPSSGEIEVASSALRVEGVESEGWQLFPTAHHPQNFCYVGMDPVRRQCTVIYHAFVSSW